MVKKRAVFIGIVLFLGLLPLADLLSPGVFIGHDTKDHIVRIAHFYQSLSEGIIIPRWSSNLNWGYGHPVMMFLYPLPSYTAALFRLLGLSFEQVTELVFAVGYVLSGLTMYLWARSIPSENHTSLSAIVRELAGIVGATLYLYAPYRFVDVYVRGAIGENFFFIWPPLVLLFTQNVVRSYSALSIVGLSISIAGMLLSHNALSIMFLPVVVGYGVVRLFSEVSRKTNKSYGNHAFTKIAVLAYSYILGFGMSAFFLIPAFIEGKYTLRSIVTQGVTLDRFETLGRIVYSPWSFGGTGQLSVQLGIVQWIVVIVGLAMVLRSVRVSEYQGVLIGSYVVLLISIYFMTKESMWVYTTFDIFQTFQFPWRWLSLALFAPSVIGALIVYRLSSRTAYICAGGIVALSLFTTMTYWHAEDHTARSHKYYTGIYEGTTDTGESSPVWSIRFMEHRPNVAADIVEGEGDILFAGRTSVSRKYVVSISGEKARVLENTLYFPGWNVYIDGVKQRLSDVWWQDPAYRGLITYFVPSGEHDVLIIFERTNVRAFSEAISAMSIVYIMLLTVFSVYKTWNKKHSIRS